MAYHGTPHLGQYPSHPHAGLGRAMIRPLGGMGIAQPRFGPNPFSHSNHAYYENPYESGNENRRRNRRRMYAERKHRHSFGYPTQGGFGAMGGLGMGGLRPGLHHGLGHPFPGLNAHAAGIFRPQMGMRFQVPRSSYAAPRVRFPGRGYPRGLQNPANAFAGRARNPFYGHGYMQQPRRRTPYSTAFDDDDSDDDEFNMRTQHRYGRRYDVELSDDDDDDDLMSSPGERTRWGRQRYGARSPWDDDDDYEDDFDDFDDDSSFDMGSTYRSYRQDRSRY